MAEEDRLSRAERRKRTQAPTAPEILGSGAPSPGGRSARAPSPPPAPAGVEQAALGATAGPTPGVTAPDPTFRATEQRALAEAERTRVPLSSQQAGPLQVPDQAVAQRGRDTQLTQLGATDSQGNLLARQGAAFQSNQRNQAAAGSAGTTLGDASGTGANTGSSSPFEQLAALRNLRTEGQQSTGTPGGFAVAPDSRTRERNARINDPRRRLFGQIERDIRRGAISNRAGRAIQENLVTAQGAQDVGRERVAADIATNKNLQQFRERQLAQQGQLGEAEIASRERRGALDRAADLQSSALQAQVDAAKLGETQAKRVQDESQFQQTQEFDRQKLGQQTQLKIAELAQASAKAGSAEERQRYDLVARELGNIQSGMAQEFDVAELAVKLLGKENAKRFFPDRIVDE